jgi:hypothetical protein
MFSPRARHIGPSGLVTGIKVLDDGTYLARMNLAGQKGAHPGGVVVWVIEYRVDGGEVVRLLTSLTGPVAFPAGELARRHGLISRSAPGSSVSRATSLAMTPQMWGCCYSASLVAVV